MPLQVRVSTSCDTLIPVYVNREDEPISLDSPYFTGQVLVRVQNYQPPQIYAEPYVSSPPTSPYFTGKRRLFSIQVKGRFKHKWTADDIWFGVVMDSELRKLPPGTDMGIKIAKIIDPGMKIDLRAHQPYSLSPITCAVNAFNISPVPDTDCIPEIVHPTSSIHHSTHMIPTSPRPEKRAHNESGWRRLLGGRINPVSSTKSQEIKGKSHFLEESSLLTREHKSMDLVIGNMNQLYLDRADPNLELNKSQHSETRISGDTPKAHLPHIPQLWLPPFTTGHSPDNLYFAEHNTLSKNNKDVSVSDRKSYFLKERNRREYTFSPNVVYGFDFYNQYLDLSQCCLKLPGISFDLTKYSDQPLRYVCQNKDGSVVFFVVEFTYID